MYINWNSNIPTTDEIQNALLTELPNYQFKRNVQKIHQLNGQTGQMEQIERVFLLVICKPLVGVKMVSHNNSLNLKQATPHLKFGNFFKMLFGHGNNDRKELMKTISLFLSKKFNGIVYDFHGRKLS